jgi:hypothetical protein
MEIHHCVMHQLIMVKLLLKYKANINEKNNYLFYNNRFQRIYVYRHDHIINSLLSIEDQKIYNTIKNDKKTKYNL